MKLKHINVIIHNFCHSFMSGSNYVDDGFVFEDLHKLANLKASDIVTINWLPYNDEQLFKLPLRVRKSVLYYRRWLPTLVAQHGLEIGSIKEFRTEVHRAKNHQIYTCAIAIDLNGKEYRKSIW